jgi:hypothetical protein
MKTHAEPNQISQFAPKKDANPAMFLKIFGYSVIFTIMSLIFSSCAGGYVATEPTYDIGYDRPQPPSEAHIWINGDWQWDHRSHAYIHGPGYWIVPREGHEYREGHWETSPRGKYWSKGYWERSRKENVHRSKMRERDRDQNNDRSHDRDHK